MGLKDAAKRLMADAGVPVTPGWLGEDQDPLNLAAEAAAIGWPVLIKAVAGGGGKGMRKVERAGDFADALLAPSAKPSRPSATIGSCWRNTSLARATSRCRFSPTRMAALFTCSSATVPFSADTRR